jgi:hypothetical protein
VSLFSRGRKESAADAIEGTAKIVAVDRDADWAGKAKDGESWWWEDAYDSFAKKGYELDLEVSIPGHEPYRVRDRFKVPAKAERTGLMRESLTPGLELPVRVDRSDPQRVEVDWSRFAADPGRKRALESGRVNRQNAQVRAQLERKPKQQEKMWAQNKQAAGAWVAAVKMGNLSREEFDHTVQLEVDSGRMDPADAEAARAQLDA